MTGENIQLAPGHPVGLCLQTRLFYHSESWNDVLQHDLNELIQHFVACYTLPASLESKNESPFQRFKAIWIELGWSKIHLFGTCDGPMRKPWTEAVMRGLLAHIKQGEPPLVQTASLFGLYLLFGTQPKAMPRTYIPVDAATLDYIISDLADALSPSLESTVPSKITSPSLDLITVIHSLLSHSAFVVIPTEAYLYPDLPSVWIKDAKEDLRFQAAQLVLGVEAEIAALQSGRAEFVKTEEGDFRLEFVGQGDGDDVERGQAGTSQWANQLRTTEANYLSTKHEVMPRALQNSSEIMQRVFVGAKLRSSTQWREATGANSGGDIEVGIEGTKEENALNVSTLGYDLLDLIGASSKGEGIRDGLKTVEKAFDELNAIPWRKRDVDAAELDQ